MTKCKHILNWNSILDFFKWTHEIINGQLMIINVQTKRETRNINS